jgi:hypothetical protein
MVTMTTTMTPMVSGQSAAPDTIVLASDMPSDFVALTPAGLRVRSSGEIRPSRTLRFGGVRKSERSGRRPLPLPCGGSRGLQLLVSQVNRRKDSQAFGESSPEALETEPPAPPGSGSPSSGLPSRGSHYSRGGEAGHPKDSYLHRKLR